MTDAKLHQLRHRYTKGKEAGNQAECDQAFEQLAIRVKQAQQRIAALEAQLEAKKESPLKTYGFE